MCYNIFTRFGGANIKKKNEIFIANLNYFLELNSIKPEIFRNNLKIPYTTYADWMNGKNFPNLKYRTKICNYLNITEDDLINMGDLEIGDVTTLFLDNRQYLTKEDINRIKYILIRRKLQAEKSK